MNEAKGLTLKFADIWVCVFEHYEMCPNCPAYHQFHLT